MYSLRLLGGVLLEGPSGPASGRAAQRRQLALLALLACARDKGLTRDKLIGYLWPETGGERARRHLSDALYVLRRSLGEEAVVAAGESLRLDPEVVRCDVCEFEHALDREDLEGAVALYDGPLLDGFYLGDGREFEGWVEAERARLADRYAGAVEALAERAEVAGAHREASEWWKRLAAHDPYNSRAMVRLVEALAAAGDPANALELARVHEIRLREEMGIEPPADLAAAIERLKQEPAPAQPSPARGEHAAPAPSDSRVVVVPKDESAATPEPWTFQRLVSEIHRRTLWQVLLVYGGASWAVFAVVQTLTEGLGLPDWFPAFALVLLLVGLPFVLATAFVQEGPPLVSRRVERGPAGEHLEKNGQTAEGIRRLLSWRNAILAGVAAFALLGVGTAAYMAMRVMGIGPVGSLVAKGVIDPQERLILTDVQTGTGDSILAIAVTAMLRTGLSESPKMRIADAGYLGRVLERMGKETDGPLDYELAREIAIREGLKAVLLGEINSVGKSYVLSLRLVSAESEAVLAAFQETAEDSTGIIPAIDRLSKRVRERAGESLRTIRSSDPLRKVTTASLPALRKYTHAARVAYGKGDFVRSIPLYEEAIALDTAFARAYRGLGAALYNAGLDRARSMEMLTKAYQLRDRQSDREWYNTEGIYYLLVAGDLEKAVSTFRSAVDAYPDYYGVLVNLSNLNRYMRDDAEAEAIARRLLALDSVNMAVWLNLVAAQLNQGKLGDAEESVKQLADNLPSAPRRHVVAAQLASARGDYDGAEAHILALRQERVESLRWRAVSDSALAGIAVLRGRLAAADRYLMDAMATEDARERYSDYLGKAIYRSLLAVSFKGDNADPVRQLEESLEAHPLDSIPAVERPYLSLAQFYALAGRPDRARELLAEYEATLEPRFRGYWEEPERRRVLGAVLLTENNFQAAIRELLLGDEGTCRTCALSLLGRAYDLAGQADSAIAVYRRYVEIPGSWRTSRTDAHWLPLIYERLGALYADRDDPANAVYYYGKFVDLWKDADPELQPRTEAAREALGALSREK